MSELIHQKQAQAVNNLEAVKKAMSEEATVYHEGKPYTVQALRMCKSQIYGGIIYQAEIVSINPLQWNHCYLVPLETIITEVEEIAKCED